MVSISNSIYEKVYADDRLKRLIEELPKMSFGRDYSKVSHSSTQGNINLADIYALADQNYPLCMQEVCLFDLDP
jgi:hypothetical protein